MKIAAFIDGPNLYASAKALGINLDYSRILEHLKRRGDLVRAHYYTAISDTEDFTAIRPLVDWLDYNGYTMVTKPIKEYTDSITGARRVKGNMDIEIAVDMLELADRVDHMYLFTGDGDFRRLIESVQRKGVRVTVVSTKETKPSMISDELRRQADVFIDLLAMKTAFEKEVKKDHLQVAS